MNSSNPEDVKKRLKKREDLFLRRLFGMFGKMAKADGKVDAWEVHAAERAFELFPRAADRRRYCIKAFNAARKGRTSLGKMAVEFASGLASPAECLAAYEILWDIALARGVLTPVHKSNLDSICRFLNLPDAYFGIYYRRRQGTFREITVDEERQQQEEQWRAEAARQAEARRRAEERRRESAKRRAEEEARRKQREWDYRRRMWDWFSGGFGGASEEPRPAPRRNPLQAQYDLLGCSPDATDEAVKKAYRLAAKKCHPDLLRASGKPQSEIDRATSQMAKLNAAWDAIRKSRGIS